MTITLGIDPGKSGSLAWLDDGQLQAVVDMPELTGAALAACLADMILEDRPAVAWVEQVHAMPKQGVKSVWTFAEGYGVILGVLGALQVPVRHVTPTVWKRAAGVSKDKETSRQRAIELWPAHVGSFSRKKDADRAEAALIALHGWNAGRSTGREAA